MRFSDPYWLLATPLTGMLLLAIWHWYDARQQAALAKFVAPQLRLKLTRSASRRKRFIQRGMFLVSTVFLFAALAGPQIGYHWEQLSHRGNEVIFAVDTSRSMLTADVKPNRLIRAKLAIDDMARQLEGDGIGIVAFAGAAFLVCPLTLDYGAFHQSLDAVDVHTIPLGGTNIPSAIEAARAAFRRPGSDRILILVTDGENLEGDALAAARAAATQDGLKIYTVGMGTTQGELIPLPPDLGGGFVKDETGAWVKSHLDEVGLRAIASASSGAYVHLEGQAENFDTFLRTVFSAVSKHDLIYRQQKIYNERYQWPLAASLAMLLASAVVSTHRTRRRQLVAVARGVAASAVLGLMIIPTRSESSDQTATPAGKGDARAPLLEYNVGTAAYRTGQFSQATEAFRRSIRAAPASDAKRLMDQQDAYYNLGNALYRAGQQLEKSAPQEALEKWTDAVKAYETALQLRRDDADSQFNRDFVRKKINALQQPPDQSSSGHGQGNGGGKGQSQSQGSSRGQPPPRGQGQPTPQNPKQSQEPPPRQDSNQPPQQQPPSHAQTTSHDPGGSQVGQSPPQAQAPPPPQNSRSGLPASDQQAPTAPAATAPTEAASSRAPGQMSPEEARELLDSARADEHHSFLVPNGPRDSNQAPEKAIRNW